MTFLDFSAFHFVAFQLLRAGSHETRSENSIFFNFIFW